MPIGTGGRPASTCRRRGERYRCGSCLDLAGARALDRGARATFDRLHLSSNVGVLDVLIA